MIQEKFIFCIVLGVIFSNAFASVEKRSTVCYGSLGCFSNEGAFRTAHRVLLSVTPSSPSSIRTKFELFTRENSKQALILDAQSNAMAKSIFHTFKNRPTKFIVHGFLDNPALIPWMHEAKDELLTHGDYNVVVVDWHRGNLPPYTQATANTRVVGAQIAQLIKQLMGDFNVLASSFHLIGHSLGAHTCGYAGERIPGLARITGLDPAGPYYDGTDKEVRLDPTDAEFVDVIHSDAESILQLGYGMREAVGHMDFFPNKGHDQPGCGSDPITKLWQYGLTSGVGEVVSCDHLRSIKFFIESINTMCPFMGFPCANEGDYMNHRCHSCPTGGCPSMGFHADQKKPSQQTKYYLSTSSSAPFCEFHVDVKIQMASVAGAGNERGNLKIQFHGDKGMSQTITLNSSPTYFRVGDAVEYHVGLPTDLGNIISVDFSWEHFASLTDPFKWNPLGLRHPKLFIHEIDVKRVEMGKEVHLYARDAAVETGHSINIANKC